MGAEKVRLSEAQRRVLERIEYANRTHADGTRVNAGRGEHVSARAMIGRGWVRPKVGVPWFMSDYEVTLAGKAALAASRSTEGR